MIAEAANAGRPVGPWVDDVAAEAFLAEKLAELAGGAMTFDPPPGPGRQVDSDGSSTPADKATLVPSKPGVKTAYPFAE